MPRGRSSGDMQQARGTWCGHGGAADMCILGEPTENKLVLGAFGLALAQAFDPRAVRTHGLQRRTPRRELDREDAPGAHRRCSSGCRPGRRRCRTATYVASRTWGRSRAVSAGARRGRHIAPTSTSTCACRPTCRWRMRGGRRSSSRARSTASRRRSYVTAPGAEIDEGHPLVAALEAAHADVFGVYARARCHALVFGRVGAHAVRDRDRSTTGRRAACPTRSLGENLEIDGLVKTADVYARAAMTVCGVAS